MNLYAAYTMMPGYYNTLKFAFKQLLMGQNGQTKGSFLAL